MPKTIDKQTKTIAEIIALLVITNLSLLFTPWSYSWAVVALFVTALLLIAKSGSLTLEDLGLSKKSVGKGLLWGGIIALVIIQLLVFAYSVDHSLFLDSRYHNLLSKALLGALITIPLHTVFVEELAFRGVLWGAIRRQKDAKYATVASSIIFGLWHIAPSLNFSRANSGLVGQTTGQFISIIGIVLVTTVAGIGLCELRRRTDSLIAPILAHWAVNGAAIVLAALAWAK